MVRAVILLVIVSALWGSSFPAIRIAVESVPPLTLAAARTFIAAVALVIFNRILGHRLPHSARLWRSIVAIAFFGNGLPFFLIGWGEEHVTGGLAAILIAVMPLATVALLQAFGREEAVTWGKLAGVIVGFAGVVVLIGPAALKGLGTSLWRELAVVGAAMSYAVSLIIVRRLPALPATALAAVVMAVAAAEMTPLAFLFEDPWRVSPSGPSALATLYIAIFSSAVPSILYFRLVAAQGATFTSFINYLIPLMGVFLGWAFLDEAVTPQAMIALACILGGVALTGIGRRGNAAQPAR